MLQNCELKMNPSDEKYLSDALHVYGWNAYCDEWNTYKLKLLPGKEFTNIATDSKKDDCTELANITMSTNPHETGNLTKILTVKVNARVMITTNINVNDGLTNGAMGTVTNVVIDERTGKMISILVAFDSKHVGQEAIQTSVYISKNQNAVPIYNTQATFPIHKKSIMSSNKKSVSINTCLGCYNTEMSRADTTWNCHRYDTCKRQIQTWRSIYSL